MAPRLILVVLAVLLAAAAPAKRPSGPAPVLVRELFITATEPALRWRWRAAPEVGLEPTLLRAMRGEAMVALGTERAAARQAMAEARKGGYPLRGYETITDWSVAADTPQLLVLQGEVWRFTGGAHGNTGYAGRLWDRQARRSIGIEALFTDWPRARKLIEPAYCAALAAEQRKRRGETAPGNDFDACPPLAEQVILPVGMMGAPARQVRVVLPPYLAGPYVEGSYTIELVWPEGVATLVAPAWKATLGFE
ncbi:hypothetical protein GCM10007973_32910 [Polymorphobacter multimanifer]|uniref:Deacetylase PdaC domain-containing protein n=1 Tax=Polymorphobacter multimanifer TaxID=1070431 RepID=A0A841LDR8_9SPHN|nr:DUF4163 domain-containing protein [Polymorphobacter multimanifer]MBB6227302.1 hypothetical protein [Polymorphobacter multimanifer]GGI94171.1 hypothetical protein GCM10007973_32910 [Polymorphobacter multimanifer]